MLYTTVSGVESLTGWSSYGLTVKRMTYDPSPETVGTRRGHGMDTMETQGMAHA